MHPHYLEEMEMRFSNDPITEAFASSAGDPVMESFFDELRDFEAWAKDKPDHEVYTALLDMDREAQACGFGVAIPEFIDGNPA